MAPSFSPSEITKSSSRITSIDAVRGLVMFTMIFVNDIAGVSPQIVPWWMRHFPAKGNGMTFVDLVFPAFLFIVGMSIPIALGSRLAKGESSAKSLLHIVIRTLSLLTIGILMVNEYPDSTQMGWSGALWCVLMYVAAILAFCTVSPARKGSEVTNKDRYYRLASTCMRTMGLVSLVVLAFLFRGKGGYRIIVLDPLSIHVEWFGILGLIGWAYLVAGLVYLLLGNHRTALLGSLALLFCLYPADRAGAFKNFFLSWYVGIGSTLGSLPAITVGGVLLGSILVAPDLATVRGRAWFTSLFIAGCASGAWLLHGLYGINKNSATPSWCLWACAITAFLWLAFYFVCDVWPQNWLAKPWAAAGQNVLLAYLLSNLMVPALDWSGLNGWYARIAEPNLACAMGRSIACAVLLLSLTAALNRIGFRLKL
jgi:heparan-alpha-glucosaminide N-acetyltransferase